MMSHLENSKGWLSNIDMDGACEGGTGKDGWHCVFSLCIYFLYDTPGMADMAYHVH